MHPTNCLNCATLLTADDHYCPTCGQKTDTHRLSMAHIWHDLVHAFTHADKGIFYTIRELAVRPGVVAREYVTGKRKKYFNPFSMLVIVLGINLLANSVFKPYSQLDYTSRDIPVSMQTGSKRAKFEKIMKRQQAVSQFMNKHTNIVLFVSTPYIAFIFWLLFLKGRYNYAEHLSTMAYSNTFFSVLMIFVFGPLLYFMPDRSSKQLVYTAMLVSHVLYLSFMYYGFMGYTSRKAYFKTLGAAVVAIIAWALFSTTIIMSYMMLTL